MIFSFLRMEATQTASAILLNLLVVVLVSLAMFGFLAYMIRRPKRRLHNLGQLRRCFELMADRCKVGDLIVIEHVKTAKSVQFVKTGAENGRSLHFRLPDAPWSREHSDRIRNALDEKGLVCRRPAGNSRIAPLLLVDDVRDLDAAIEMTGVVFSALDVSWDGVFQVYCKSGDPHYSAA